MSSLKDLMTKAYDNKSEGYKVSIWEKKNVDTIELANWYLAIYLTRLGIKYGILTVLNEAHTFEKLVAEGLISGLLDLNYNMTLGRELIEEGGIAVAPTHINITLNRHGVASGTIELTKYVQVATIISAIYHELIKEIKHDYTNRLCIIDVHQHSGETEQYELASVITSNKIGIKLNNPSIDSVEVVRRYRKTAETVVVENPSLTQALFVEKTYHSDFLIQFI